MRPAVLLLAILALAAGPARSQPAPPEPGDEEEGAGQPSTPTPPAPSSEAYDARVRQSFAAAEGFQGPLDGGWTLSAAGKGQLYAIRISEHDGRLEAVWRDLRRPGALDASGFVDDVERFGGRLTLRFSPAAGQRDVAVLSPLPGGGWSGELDENGRKRAVTLAKTSP